MSAVDTKATSNPDPPVVARVRTSVRQALDRLKLSKTRRLVVAVSGGVDSLCLLDALVAALPDAHRRLRVVHVDHSLRPTSHEDAEYVRSVADGYRLGAMMLTVDVPALAQAEGRGIEEAARLGRYRAIRDAIAAQAGWPADVATGHTRDDVVETVLLHLLRGSGPSGLGGIQDREMLDPAALGEVSSDAPGRTLCLVRPLTEVDRAETVAYCEARGIRYLTDETNSNPAYLRNRVRSHLLPVLRTYNPAIGRGLSRLAITMRDEERWLDDLVARTWRRIARPDPDDPSVHTVSRDTWGRQHPALQRRLVRHFAVQAGFWEIGFEAVERALLVGDDWGPPRAELGAGLVVRRHGNDLRFVAPTATSNRPDDLVEGPR
ncbi:MAG: tRNA lysidine(34) synthetase TilS [Chloroflexi bacterium]|nr:tRNA lysidine(34) synthetase TilS [Chloroflexota bacterium]